MGYETESKERSFGNVKSCDRRCRSYAPLTWFHIPFLQTLSELRSYILLKKRPQNIFEKDIREIQIFFKQAHIINI